MPQLTGFSDEELSLIQASAQPLAPWQRAAFLQAVVLALRDQRGPAAVHRACVETQRKFLRAPDLSRSRDYSRWR
jgi:hypothetical protein